MSPRNPHAEQRLAARDVVIARQDRRIEQERAVIAERFYAERRACGSVSFSCLFVALVCVATGAPGWVPLVFFTLAVSSAWLWLAVRSDERAWRAGR